MEDEPFRFDASRGWTAFTSEAGAGCAIRMPYEPLMCLYNFFGGVSTIEWMNRSRTVPPGQSLESEVSFLPFTHLTAVDAVDADLVAGFTLPDKVEIGAGVSGKLVVHSAVPLKTKIALSAQRLPQGAATDLGAKSAEFKADGTQELEVSFPAGQEGTWLVTAEITRDGTPPLRVQRPVAVGKSTTTWVMAPEAKRIGDENEKLEGIASPGKPKEMVGLKLRGDVVSPHTAWAKPWYRGKPKVLFVMGVNKLREVIELAQRADLDYDNVTLSAGVWYGAQELARQGWVVPQSLADLEKKMEGPEKYDAIVISHPNMEIPADKVFTERVQKALVARVAKGCGLVFMSRADLMGVLKTKGPMLQLLPVSAPKRITTGSAWQATRPHFISTGFPYAAMPSTFPLSWVDEEKVPAEKKLVVNAEGTPVVLVSRYEQGRVVVLNWDSPYGGGPGTMVEQGGRDDARSPFLVPKLGFGYGNTPDVDCLVDNGPRSSVYVPNQPTDRLYVPFRYADYYLSMLAKSVYWAAGRASEVEITELKPSSEEFFRETLGAAVIQLTVQSHQAKPATLTAAVDFLDEFSRIVASGQQKIEVSPDRSVSASFHVPAAMPGGTGFMHLRLKDGEKVVNWGATSFRIAQPARVETVTLPEPPLALGPVKGEARVKGKVQGELLVAVRDSNGRIFQQQKLPVQGDGETVVPLALDLGAIRTTVAYVDLELWAGGARVDRVSRRTVVTKAPPPRNWINAVDCYTFFRNYMAPTWIRQAHALGSLELVEPVSLQAATDGDMMLAGIGELAQVTGWHYYYPEPRKGVYAELKRMYDKTRDLKYLIRSPCQNDPAYRKKVLDRGQDMARKQMMSGAHEIMFGDEVSVTSYGDCFDFCYCEHCLREFRVWLKTVYPDLAALNKEWGTAFKDWDALVPMTFDEARKADRFASWADHKRFMEVSFHDFMRAIRTKVREVDPQARLALSGTQDPAPWGGMDLWLRVNTFDALRSYNSGMQHPAMQYSLNPALEISKWVGYTHDYPDGSVMGSVLDGLSGTSYWHEPLFLNPDLTASTGAERLSQISLPWIKGPMNLLFEAEWPTRGAAVLYSQSSIRASAFAIRGERSFGTWAGVLEAMGLDYQGLSYEQLAKGELVKRKFRVLILPECVALSRQECDQIRVFAEGGGVVIADLRPAVFNEHCTPFPKGALDDFFGVKVGQTPSTFQGRGIRFVENPPAGYESVAKALFYTMPTDADLVADGAQALGLDDGAQAIFYRKVGRGAAVLLNMPVNIFGGLASDAAAGRERGWTSLFLAMFRSADAIPSVRLNEPGKDWPARALKMRRWVKGPLTYIGMNLAPAPRELVLPEARHVYDVLAGKALGKGVRFPVEPTKDIRLFAVLPYRVESLSLEAPGKIIQGTEFPVALVVKADGGPLGDHYVRLTLTDPSGREAEWAARNVPAPSGKGRVVLRMALNDVPGKWKLHATDVATGVSAEKVLEIVEPTSR